MTSPKNPRTLAVISTSTRGASGMGAMTDVPPSYTIITFASPTPTSIDAITTLTPHSDVTTTFNFFP